LTAPRPAVPAFRYRWYAAGDVNAFLGLMLDNVVNLALLGAILVGAFGFPADLVYTRMFPARHSACSWETSFTRGSRFVSRGGPDAAT
jgi:hypothetical protein